MDRSELCFPSSGSADHSRSADEDLQTSWSRTLTLLKFAVLHGTCMLLCQLALYLLACRGKFGPLFQNHDKDFTNQESYTCKIVHRCCPHVCILCMLDHFLSIIGTWSKQHCFTSGLLFKATEDPLGLAWSRLKSTNTSSNESCIAMYVLFSAKQHKCPWRVFSHRAATCITVLEDAVMTFLQWWQL